MMNWDKCADVIHRLSSRVNNGQNQSTIVDNCDTMIPFCIEKSFYQSKDNAGQEYCVEMCGNCPDSLKLSNGFAKNTNVNKWKTSICDTKNNEQILNSINSYRNQFALSNMFDNKRKYIDYVVATVLRQVVNYVPIDCLYQLSCCLPQNIEEVLQNVTDMDSDRLVRILVAQVLQSYGTNTGQLTDWYAFANSFLPRVPSAKAKADKTGNKKPSKSKKLSKQKKKSKRVLDNHTESPYMTTPVSSLTNKKPSSESMTSSKVASPSIDTNILSGGRTPLIGVIPKIMSTTSSTTPTRPPSKETFTPTGTKYQPKTKSDENFILDKTNEIDHHKSHPFREKSTNRSSSNRSHTQYRISSASHYYHHKSDNSSDRSSSGDCILTIQHKHKHKRASDHHHHHHQRNQYTTTSFDTPSIHSLSSHNSVPTEDSGHNYKQTSVDIIPARTKSQRNINSNLVNTEQLKPSDLFTTEQMLLFKSGASSDSTDKHLHQNESSSFQSPLHDAAVSSGNNQHKISRSMNEVEVHEHPITDNHQVPSSKNLNKFSLSSSNNRVQLNTNPIPLMKKALRINHHPNMLADFD